MKQQGGYDGHESLKTVPSGPYRRHFPKIGEPQCSPKIDLCSWGPQKGNPNFGKPPDVAPY